MGFLVLERFSSLDNSARISIPAQAQKKKKSKTRYTLCLPHVTVGPFYLAVLNSQWERPIALATFVWGDNCTPIANAITGQTSGFTLPSLSASVWHSSRTTYAAGRSDVPRTRLAMKLEYSHTVYVVVPEGIKVTMSIRTIIVEMRREPYKVRLFFSCSCLGRLLTEYPQGVFVNNERLKMKSGKMKSFLDRHTCVYTPVRRVRGLARDELQPLYERCPYFVYTCNLVLTISLSQPLGFETLLLIG